MFTHLILREIDSSLGGALLGNGLDQEARASDEELVINGESSLILGEYNEMRPRWGASRSISLVKYRNGIEPHLTTGMPFTLDSRNAVYQIGSIEYRRAGGCGPWAISLS